jgi:two-component system aerobic respiration control sensor histidine kinase ArcB
MDNKATLNIDPLQQENEAYKSEIYRLKSIIDNLPGSIYWKDKDGVYLGRNLTSAESMKSMDFPWRKEDTIGKTDYDLFSQALADQFRDHDKRIQVSQHFSINLLGHPSR